MYTVRVCERERPRYCVYVYVYMYEWYRKIYGMYIVCVLQKEVEYTCMHEYTNMYVCMYAPL